MFNAGGFRPGPAPMRTCFKRRRLPRAWSTALLVWAVRAAAQSSTNSLLPHDAYVWQRAWTSEVRDAVTQYASSFSNLVVLAAEVSWKQGQPEVVRVPVDYAVLRSTPARVGLALRIRTLPRLVQ